jgi:hypothetical protein
MICKEGALKLSPDKRKIRIISELLARRMAVLNPIL